MKPFKSAVGTLTSIGPSQPKGLLWTQREELASTL